ncbi:uncharacterized protein PHALS_14766 [Plasmopara halstedii]|uniref:Uncharacterized protein n=1 Tax=Plasmopara halstedii TaxID=4781 RepID=A0A0N7L6S7_PLAHL|nr:uncharacterized protein PHALS_14766 [Plasmopara halstedii]CEG45107.1 hypothetical protein PHALS_14766 [Plasmopara halstedii]|eukprot:XP_024581476.1 hypothetical protein PHALS_14766 [Plasmopara halstedii]
MRRYIPYLTATLTQFPNAARWSNLFLIEVFGLALETTKHENLSHLLRKSRLEFDPLPRIKIHQNSFFY